MPKVLVLFDVGEPAGLDVDYTEDLKSPEWKTERHVLSALRELDYPFAVLGVHDDTGLIREMVERYQPDVIFNMVERFANSLGNENRITSFLELQDVPITGCGSTGITLSKDKTLSKKIASFHGIKVPRFTVHEPGDIVRLDEGMQFPLIVKPIREEASYGISLKSVVQNEEELVDRVCFVQERFKQEALVEEFIVGREVYVGVIGNERLQCLPPREMTFGRNVPVESRFASYSVKWDEDYRIRWGIKNRFLPSLNARDQAQLNQTCKNIYRALNLTGYARMDLRLTSNSEPIFIEANPNPMLAKDEDFALAARKAGLDYPKLISKIISLAV
ncbi:MAG: ATP-grasp domain-containing protein [Verrucomicrobiota bacterium]|jgi:D-alanine-D-alanine ligase|nr:ATP-grasp domain-containing protein [Verrucomicrobiota bacterium]